MCRERKRIASTCILLCFACAAAVGCSLTSDEAVPCRALDYPFTVSDTTTVRGSWGLDHFRAFGSDDECVIQEITSSNLYRTLDFRSDGTYRETIGAEAREGEYAFVPTAEAGSDYRLLLDGNTTPLVRINPDTLVIDYRSVGGGQFVFLRLSSAP